MLSRLRAQGTGLRLRGLGFRDEELQEIEFGSSNIFMARIVLAMTVDIGTMILLITVNL